MMRRILIILGKDVHNKSTHRIYKECQKRGFKIEIYSTDMNDNHALLFNNDNVEIKDIRLISDDDINKCDYIFSAVPLFGYPIFLRAHKYIFLNPSTHFDEAYFSGDFIFTVRDLDVPLIEGEKMAIEELNYRKSLPAMATGGPQFFEKEKRDNKAGVILFVDAGHYPFGTKKELANYIVEIALYCSDYELRIKPRYLPTDISTTHVNKENLISYLDEMNDLPPNIKIIREHTDLSDELEQVELVICPEGTSSYEEAILQRKRIIIFTGFPNMESMIWSKRRLQHYNKIPKELQCRINYKDIFKYLPDGFEIAMEDLNKSFYKLEGVDTDIVDAMEYIFEKYISKNNFPKALYYKSENKFEDLVCDKDITWDDIIASRYKKMLYDEIAIQVSNLSISIDCNPIVNFIESNTMFTNAENFNDKLEQLRSILYDIYICNGEIMMESAYSQSLLCMAYYKQKRFEEFAPQEMKCKAYYSYCQGKNLFDEGKYEDSVALFLVYFDEVNKNQYEVSLADDPSVKAMAHYYYGATLFHMGDNDGAYKHLSICDAYWNGKHIKAKEYLSRINKR